MEPLGWFDRSVNVPLGGMSGSLSVELVLTVSALGAHEASGNLATLLNLVLSATGGHAVRNGNLVATFSLSMAAEALRHPRLRNGIARRRRGIVRRRQ